MNVLTGAAQQGNSPINCDSNLFVTHGCLTLVNSSIVVLSSGPGDVDYLYTMLPRATDTGDPAPAPMDCNA